MTQSERKKRIEALKKKLEKLNVELGSLRKECDHTEQTPEIKEWYFEGSYYDKAYTETIYYCSICEKRINSDHKEHSWYG